MLPVLALPVAAPVTGPAIGAALTLVAGGTLRLWQEHLKFRQGPLPFPPVTGRELEPNLRELLEDFAAGARIPVGFPSPPPLPDLSALLAIAAAAGVVAGKIAEGIAGLWSVLNSRPRWGTRGGGTYFGVPTGTYNPKGFNLATVYLLGARPRDNENYMVDCTRDPVQQGMYIYNIPLAPGQGIHLEQVSFEGRICPQWENHAYIKVFFPQGFGNTDTSGGIREIFPTPNWIYVDVSVVIQPLESGIEGIDVPWALDVLPYWADRPLPEIEPVTPEKKPVAPVPMPPVLPMGVPGLIPGAVPAPAPGPGGAPSGPSGQPAPGPARPGQARPRDPRLPAGVAPAAVPTLPPLIVPQLPGAQPIDSSGRPVPQAQARPATTRPGSHVVGTQVIPSNGPRPDLAGIAAEVGRIERKMADMMRRPQQGQPEWLEQVPGWLGRILEILDAVGDQGSYTLGGSCERDEQGNPIPFEETVQTWEWGGNLNAFGNMGERLDAIASMLQAAQLLRQPTCKNPPPVGELVTVNFKEVMS